MSNFNKVRLYFQRGEEFASGLFRIQIVEKIASREVDCGCTELTDARVWQQSVEVVYRFESRQEFKVNAIHKDGSVHLTGCFQLGRLVSARGGTLTLDTGVTITAVSQSANERDQLTLQFSAIDLPKIGLFGSSNTYFTVQRTLPNGATRVLHTSRVVCNNLCPVWEPCPPLPLSDLVGRSTRERVLTLSVFNTGLCTPSLIGCFAFSVEDIPGFTSSEPRAADPVSGTSSMWQLKHGDSVRGLIRARLVRRTHEPSFTELLGAGLQINLAVAVDMTASNGTPSERSSLHYMGGTNQYMQAIKAVCDVLLEYDNDKLVPAFGFGAYLPNGQVSHCFHLNGQPDPNVYACEGILDAYRSALRSVKLGGPTNFAPCIRQAELAARATPQTYTILLILTDGCINDTDDTIDAIVACGDAPLSIIIIGVGQDDFTTMDVLDGDEVRLTSSGGVRCLRDLVQFVPFRDFADVPRERLAAEVLEEVPRQVEEWASINKISAASFQRS